MQRSQPWLHSKVLGHGFAAAAGWEPNLAAIQPTSWLGVAPGLKIDCQSLKLGNGILKKMLSTTRVVHSKSPNIYEIILGF